MIKTIRIAAIALTLFGCTATSITIQDSELDKSLQYVEKPESTEDLGLLVGTVIPQIGLKVPETIRFCGVDESRITGWGKNKNSIYLTPGKHEVCFRIESAPTPALFDRLHNLRLYIDVSQGTVYTIMFKSESMKYHFWIEDDIGQTIKATIEPWGKKESS